MVMITAAFSFIVFGFKLCFLISFCWTWTAAHNFTTPVPQSLNVGVILDTDSWIGKMSNTCIATAVQDFYAVNHHYKTRLILHTRDSKDLASAVFAAVELLKNVEVEVIVGPQKSGQAEIVAELGNRSHVPVVSFSATSPSISRDQIPYFIRMTQNDTYQIEAIVSIILEFQWKEVCLVYEETDYRNEIIPLFINVLQAYNVRVRYRSVIPPSAMEHQIAEELDKLLQIPIRVFVVHMSSSLGPLFFLKVKEVGLMSEGSAWIITEELTNLLGSMDHSVIVAMHGVIGAKPHVSSSEELRNISSKIIRKLLDEWATPGDLNIFCLQAYDTIWALAMAAERVYSNRSKGEQGNCRIFADITELCISEMGPELLKEILKSHFNGLSGEIRFIAGQLQPIVYEIVNVVGQGERTIGFWLPRHGISQKPNEKSQSHLLPIIWPGPGESTIVPKGWVFPAKVKKLKIGYLLKDSFSQLVNVSSDGTVLTGDCIEVFKEAAKALPYVLPYEFIPFQKANGENEATYKDLVHQVFLKRYDAVVADITITANRSLFMDFSIPYTHGGVAMLVPVRYDKTSNWLILFEQFSTDSGLLHFALSASIFVIWCLQLFKCSKVGASCQEIGKLSVIARTLQSVVSAIRELDGVQKVSNFLVHIYVLAYIGLVMQALVKVWLYDNRQLAIVNANDLVKSGDLVGYQKGSIVEVVLKQLNFDQSQLKAYNSPEEYGEALDKGSQNGGVAAIFDEVPYIDIFLQKYCGRYRRVGPIYQMSGFGFIFPRGSPLVPDFSRAISSVLEGEKMTQIEKRRPGSKKHCPDPPKNISSLALSHDEMKLTLVIFLIFSYSIHLLYKVAHTHSETDKKFPRLLKRIFRIQQNQVITVQQASSTHLPAEPHIDITVTEVNDLTGNNQLSVDTETSNDQGLPVVKVKNRSQWLKLKQKMINGSKH